VPKLLQRHCHGSLPSNTSSWATANSSSNAELPAQALWLLLMRMLSP
jgi:hypothetical protein